MAKFSFDLLNPFRRSAALQRIAHDEQRLRNIVKDDPRKIIPVAEVARWLEVSNRQMWNWIDQGWISTYKRPSESYKKGISKLGFNRFLKRLGESLKYSIGMCSPLGLGRPAKAREKIQKAYSHDFLIERGMTPTELGTKLGVSSASVRRAIHQGVVPGRKPSPNRYKLVPSSFAPQARKKRSKSI